LIANVPKPSPNSSISIVPSNVNAASGNAPSSSDATSSRPANVPTPPTQAGDAQLAEPPAANETSVSSASASNVKIAVPALGSPRTSPSYVMVPMSRARFTCWPSTDRMPPSNAIEPSKSRPPSAVAKMSNVPVPATSAPLRAGTNITANTSRTMRAAMPPDA
jgi:hypothetical protein